MKSITTQGRYVYGRDYLEPNQRALFNFSEKRAGGLTPGNKMTIRQKMDGNEDAMAWLPLEDGRELWLLADSHLGRMAGELSVGHFLEHFEQVEGNDQRRLFETHLRLNQAVLEAKEENRQLPLNCATTLVSVIVDGTKISYCSTGDSHVFHIRNGRTVDMFEPNPGLFVGDSGTSPRMLQRALEEARILDPLVDETQTLDVLFELARIQSEKVLKSDQTDHLFARLEAITGLKPDLPAEDFNQPWHDLRVLMSRTLPVWGEIDLRSADVVLIATDGIDEETSSLTMKDIGKIFKKSDTAAHQLAEVLLDKAMGKRGCDDNLMFLFGQF